MPLTLVVPDLLPPADAPPAMRDFRLPHLEKWLARAEISRAAARDADAWLATEYGVVGETPHAAIALVGDGGPREGTWLHADPVHLRIDRDSVALHDASVLDLATQEAASFVAALQEHFRSDSFTFAAPVPHRWYACIDAGIAPITTPLREAVGRNIFGLLPTGGGSFNWRSATTEAQMVLSNHEANAKREAAGKPTVNSVWFWGAGEAPAHTRRRFEEVHADSPFARGLAMLSGIHAEALPFCLALIPVGTPGGERLVVADSLTRLLRTGDLGAWSAGARELDDIWFEGLGRTAAWLGGVNLVLPAEGAVVVARIPPNARWRFFAKRRPWTAYA